MCLSKSLLSSIRVAILTIVQRLFLGQMAASAFLIGPLMGSSISPSEVSYRRSHWGIFNVDREL